MRKPPHLGRFGLSVSEMAELLRAGSVLLRSRGAGRLAGSLGAGPALTLGAALAAEFARTAFAPILRAAFPARLGAFAAAKLTPRPALPAAVGMVFTLAILGAGAAIHFMLAATFAGVAAMGLALRAAAGAAAHFTAWAAVIPAAGAPGGLLLAARAAWAVKALVALALAAAVEARAGASLVAFMPLLAELGALTAGWGPRGASFAAAEAARPSGRGAVLAGAAHAELHAVEFAIAVLVQGAEGLGGAVNLGFAQDAVMVGVEGGDDRGRPGRAGLAAFAGSGLGLGLNLGGADSERQSQQGDAQFFHNSFFPAVLTPSTFGDRLIFLDRPAVARLGDLACSALSLIDHLPLSNTMNVKTV